MVTIGALWASGIGASLAYNSRARSPLNPSLRLIHARYLHRPNKLYQFVHKFVYNKMLKCVPFLWVLVRMHAQALTLVVLSSAAVYHFYEKRGTEQEESNASPKWESCIWSLWILGFSFPSKLIIIWLLCRREMCFLFWVPCLSGSWIMMLYCN
jgi:hypothetical protein